MGSVVIRRQRRNGKSSWWMAADWRVMGALSLNIILYELQIANLIKNTITYGRLQKTGGNQYKSKK